jgi:uncharacterized protein YciI
MKLNLCLIGAVLLVAPHFAPFAAGESEPDFEGKKIEEELAQRETNIQSLSIEEQLKLRAAQKKAAEDPAVIAALEKRTQAINEFRMALRKSMIASDPKVEPILDKIAVGGNAGF